MRVIGLESEGPTLLLGLLAEFGWAKEISMRGSVLSQNITLNFELVCLSLLHSRVHFYSVVGKEKISTWETFCSIITQCASCAGGRQSSFLHWGCRTLSLTKLNLAPLNGQTNSRLLPFPSLPFPSTFHANARGKEWNGMACPMATRPRYAISVGVGPTLIYVESFSIQFCGKPLSSPASDVASYLKETRVTVEE